MYTATKIKLDKRGDAYWSVMLIHDNQIMREVVSQTFNAFKPHQKWKEWEKAQNRMAKELMNEGSMEEQKLIARMFMSGSEFDRHENSDRPLLGTI